MQLHVQIQAMNTYIVLLMLHLVFFFLLDSKLSNIIKVLYGTFER